MVSAEQIEALVSFLESQPDLVHGRYNRTTEGRSECRRLWLQGADIINGVPGGVQKEPEGWRMFYNEFKSKLFKRIKKNENGSGPFKLLTPLQERLYSMLSRSVVPFGGLGYDLHVQVQMDPKEQDSSSQYVEGAESTPKPKKGKSIVFASVKQACIDLVKKHGHSVSLIDEEAFRTLIQLMPMTMKEKARITSEYIQKCVDSTGEEDDADMSYQEERDASDNDDETTTDRVITIKGEIEEVQCNCNARVSEESNKFHEVGCPAAARQPYWNYFEVTTDEATCHICNLTLNWTNITKLKEHLLEKHPTAEFVDDGEEFVRGPASDVWSHEDTEEVYLEDDFDLDPLPTPSAKKRKRTSERLKSRDDRTLGEEDKLRQERVRAERLRTMRDERHGLSEASRKVIELAPDRFKSLDSFGQYVAELMKLIPKEKCLKYQVQIVQRLLQEQAAAG